MGFWKIAALSLLLAASLLLALPQGTLPAQDAAAQQQVDYSATGYGMTKALFEGELDQVMDWFAPELAAALNRDQLKQTLSGVTYQHGELSAVGTPEIMALPNGATIVYTPVAFQRGQKLQTLIEFKNTPQGVRVTSLFIQGLGMRVSVAGVLSKAPYVDGSKFTEREFRVDNRLNGALAVPNSATESAPVPAVLLLSGSGPTDMDGSSGPNKPLRDLAQGLATQGIVTLRYNKRTVGQAKPDPAITPKEEVVLDALIALNQLREVPGVDYKRVFILGHSLGGVMAPEIAQQDGAIAGLVLMMTPTAIDSNLVGEQFAHLRQVLTGPGAQMQTAQYDSILSQIRTAESGQMPDQEMAMGASGLYWKDLVRRRPAEVVAGLTMPIALGFGARDYQVQSRNAAEWAEAIKGRAGSGMRVYDHLNHLMIPGQGMPAPAEYEISGFVAQEVVADVTNFIMATTP